MVLKVLTVLMLVVGATVLAQVAPETPEAIEGLDPVLLTQGKEVPGKDALAVVHSGLKYFFATAHTKAAFEKHPEQYAVHLDGTCARMGSAVGGNPNTYSVHDGRIYLFGSDNCKEISPVRRRTARRSSSSRAEPTSSSLPESSTSSSWPRPRSPAAG